MEAVVDEVMKGYQSDFFKYDQPRIASSDFKFPAIWIIGEYHTHRLELGNYKDLFFEAESVRYSYARNNNPYAYFIESSNYKNDRWYLLTEDGMQLINREQAQAAIMDYVTPAVEAWKAENGSLPKLEKVKVVIKNITFSKLKELIADCRSHNNDSLMDCFRLLHNLQRVASDHYVEVSYNSSWNEFIACEYINGKQGVVRGFVFHGWPETGYQTNGSVQLDPRYGWSSHS